jgi:hypothetical protein
MTAPPVLVDIEVVAATLGLDMGHVRQLVHRGILESCGTEKRQGSAGRPRLMFDWRDVTDRLRGTRYWPECVTDPDDVL